MLVLTLALSACPLLTQEGVRTIDPILTVRAPDVQAAWKALGDTALARLLADDEVVAFYRRMSGEVDATPRDVVARTLQEAFSGGFGAPTPEELGSIGSLSFAVGLLEGTMTRSGVLASTAELLFERGQMAFVLDVADDDAGSALHRRLAPVFDVVGTTEPFVDSKLTWTVVGDRCELHVGASGITMDIASLDVSFERLDDLPQPTGTVLGEAWLAPFQESFVFEPDPIGSALRGAGGLVLGLPFVFGPNGAQVRVALSEGRIVVDETHSIVDPVGEGVLGTRPLSDGALALALPDACLATVASIDDATLGGILDQLVGIQVSAAITDSLGPDAAISVLPIKGLQTPTVLITADHTDRVALAAGLETLLARFVEVNDGDVVLHRQDYRGADLLTLAVEDEGLFPPELAPALAMLRPTFALTDDRVILTTAPLAAKKEIRRLSKDLTVHAGLAAIDAPEGASSVTFVDWGSAFASVYSMGLSILALQGGVTDSEGEMLSREDFPSHEVFTRHMPPGFRWTVVRDGVRTYHSETSVDTFDVLGVVGTWATLVMPDMFERLETAERAKAQADVRSLHTAVQMYVLDNGALPRDLEVLIESSASRGPGPPSDPWGAPYRYEAGDEFEFEVWSVGPNGVDESGGGDDVTLDR